MFRILNKHGIKLNRGNHSGPIKRENEEDTSKDMDKADYNEKDTFPSRILCHRKLSDGSCLKEAFENHASVLTPDLPLHPKEALKQVRSIIEQESPDLLLGNSCGSFLAQMLAPIVGIPALLGNPHFEMTKFLKERIGEHQYKAPRKDGNQTFIIDEALIEEFAKLEKIQFDCCNPYYRDRVWGLFGEQDRLAHYEPMFLEHYNNSPIISRVRILPQNRK